MRADGVRARARTQLRQPRLAELVADELRDRILSAEQLDGGLLPKQEDLLDEFRVSAPSIREALRILETEGLVTVLRGNTGGATVRRPSASKVAYMAALVLQSQEVGLDDVAAALTNLEPRCAAMAAARDDRATTVVPALEARIEAQRAVVHDPEAFAHESRRFHEDLVAGCGNQTMILVIGAIESLWSAHLGGLARKAAHLGAFQQREVRDRALEEHEALAGAIADGDADEAQRLSIAHFAFPERLEFIADRMPVRASLLKGR